MRPIQLKIKGLHSFREMVMIDFDRLCQGGVFGIFGPTGSGKSTILDAITLSLFGKVERAANNTQGIINQRETELFVSYTFELMKGSGVRRFRVERTYKQENESVRNKTSRLLELIPTERVIADKDRDVTRQVETLLGLTVEDFTRAVVLPQSKFDEFLSLKGNDRRKMLERLFHLGEYGEALNERLKRKVDETSLSLERIKGMQQALGDASEERLAEAQKREEEAMARFEAARSRRIAVEKRLQAEEKLWNDQKELDAVLVNQRMHLAHKEEMEKKAEALSKGEEAERLYPLLQKMRQGEEEALRLKKLTEETKENVVKTKVAYEAAKQAAEIARDKRDRLFPLLTLRIDRLQEGKAALLGIAERKKELKNVYGDVERIAKAKAEKEKERAEKEALLDRAREKQMRLVEEMAEIRITAEERESWRRISAAYQEIEMLLPEGKRIAGEKEEASRKLAEAEKEMRASEERIGELAERGSRNLRDWLGRRETYEVLLKEMDQLLHAFEGEMERVYASIEAKRHRSYAAELAKSLREGEPCPVCGSTHHINPTRTDMEEEGGVLPSDWSGLQTRLREGKSAGEKLRDRLREDLYRFEEIGRRFEGALLPDLLLPGAAAAAAAAAIPPAQTEGDGASSYPLRHKGNLTSSTPFSPNPEGSPHAVTAPFSPGSEAETGGLSNANDPTAAIDRTRGTDSSPDNLMGKDGRGGQPHPYDTFAEAEEAAKSLTERLEGVNVDHLFHSEDMKKKIEVWQRDLERLEKERNGLTSLLPLLEERKNSLRGLEKREEEHLMRVRAKKEAFAAAFPDLPFEDVKRREKMLAERERKEEELKARIDKSVQFLEEQDKERNGIEKEIEGLERQLAELRTAIRLKEERIREEEERLTRQLSSLGEAHRRKGQAEEGEADERGEGIDGITVGYDPTRPPSFARNERSGQTDGEQQEEILPLLDQQGRVSEVLVDAALQKAKEKRTALENEVHERDRVYQEVEKRYRNLEEKVTALSSSLQYAENHANALRLEWEKELAGSSFQGPSEVEEHHHTREEMEAWRKSIEEYSDRGKALEREIERLTALLRGRRITEEMWRALLREKETAFQEDDEAAALKARASRDREELERKAAEWKHLETERKGWAREKELFQRLQSVLKGNAFVEFIAEEHLHRISKEASDRLLFLTRNRYALELDSTGGFVIRDDMNGGERRLVHSLSGGETFLTSLALALSLSSQIQLKGEYPLQFFFLDEGFGTLDPALLDLALTALERIHEQSLSIGIISHVPELKERIMKRLIVEPADFSGRGSRVRIETV